MISIEEIKKKYGNEISLVILCCRVHFATEKDFILQDFVKQNHFEWYYFFYLAAYHRIEPTIYQVLQKANIPTEIAAKIKNKQLLLIQQSFNRALETERIINRLKEYDIRCIPYKGVTLSNQLYGNIISRESSDIDLIVYPDNFDRIFTVMKQDGYSFENQMEYNYFKEDIFKRNKDLSFNKYQNEIRQFHVEFHWKITDNALRIERSSNNLLFADTITMHLAKNEVEVLNINSHYLAVFIHHSHGDGFSILRNLLDMSQIVVQKQKVDNLYINNAIADFRLTKAAAICSYLSNELFGITIPLLTTDATPLSTSIKEYFKEQLLNKKMIGNHFKVKLLRKNIFYLKDNNIDRIMYFFSSLQLRFTPGRKDIRIFNLPRKFYFLYIILKPFRSIISPASIEEEKKIAKELDKNSKKLPH